MDSDDFGDDDEWDALPVTTLRQLELDALQSTQANAGHRDSNQSFTRQDLGPQLTTQAAAAAVGHHRPPVRQGAALQGQSSSTHAPPVRQDLQRERSSDYGLEDEDVVDLDARAPVDEATQREQFRLQRYGARPALQQQHQPQRPPQPPGGASATATTRPQQPQLSQAPLDVATLQARISQLEQTQSKLLQDHESAKQQALTRAGEISIIRANHEKTVKEYEKRMAEQRQRQLDELAKQKAELDAARKERERIETNNKFLKHDLQQETERARTLRRAQQDAAADAVPAKRASPLSTPSKRRTLPYRDGFDDDEIMLVSPVKAKENKSKPATPTGTHKRKRADSTRSPAPVHNLSFAEGDGNQVSADAGTPLSVKAGGKETVVPRDEGHGEQFEVSQLVLEHRTRAGQRILEALSGTYLPSDPLRSLASYIYDALRLPIGEASLGDAYRLRIADAILAIWRRCMDEKTYGPLCEMTDLLVHLLLESPESLAAEITLKTAALCQETARLLAIPRFALAKNPDEERSRIKVTDDMLAHVRPYDMLCLLQVLAQYCEMHSAAALNQFWMALEQDFVLLMLAKGQPLSHWLLMLDILGTSCQRATFGVVVVAPDAPPAPAEDAISTAAPSPQATTEADLLTRLTVLLVGPAPKKPALPDADDVPADDPDAPASSGAYGPRAHAALRTSVLALLKRAAATPAGARAASSHRLLVGRLARLLHESVAALYGTRPAALHAAAADHANNAVLLLAKIARPETLSARLALEPGGVHKHLVGLSRVAFAEGATLVEAGLWPGAVDAAHRMLDEVLSPEEGDAVVSVFSSGR